VEQKIDFDEVSGKYIKLRALKVHGNDPRAPFAEIVVLTTN